MKKIIMMFLALGLFATSFGQTDYKKRPSIGIHFAFNDFSTAATLRSAGLSRVLNTKEWKKTKNMNPGLAFSYLQGLNSNIDFVATATGSFVDYPIPGKALKGTDDFLLEVATTANVKLLTDEYWFSPFLTVGAGASKYRGYYAAFVPIGAGIQFNIVDETYLILNTQYRVSITENAAYHLYHSIGFASNLFKKKEIKVVELPVIPVVKPEPPKDRDGDGVLDADDKCPDVKGLAAFSGCPDTDGDGITDAEDNCPTVAGLAKYKGCPIPDTDKDGINDEADKCPTVPGVARYQGCPIPDTDGDGINDEEDKCPTEKGIAANNGCPTLEDFSFNPKAVQFITGSAQLTAKAKAELDKGANILTEHSTLNVTINGYTDITGKPATNLALSKKRAESVKAYWVKKGVSANRLTANGYGIENPIADNKTAAGRTKNRRVEFKVNN